MKNQNLLRPTNDLEHQLVLGTSCGYSIQARRQQQLLNIVILRHNGKSFIIVCDRDLDEVVTARDPPYAREYDRNDLRRGLARSEHDPDGQGHARKTGLVRTGEGAPELRLSR